MDKAAFCAQEMAYQDRLADWKRLERFYWRTNLSVLVLLPALLVAAIVYILS
jgi:hypothetical protein